MAETKYPMSLVIRLADQVTRPLEALNSRLEKTGSRLSAPFVRLGNRLGALGAAAGLPALGASLGRVGDAAGALGGKVLGLGTVFAGLAVAGSAGLIAIVRSAEAAGSRLNDMSARTGLSVQAFAELEFAAKKAGVGGEEFGGGMEKLNRALSEARRGSGPLFASLKKDGGAAFLQQLKGAKSNEEAFGLLAKAMQGLKDPGKRAVLAVAAFGKSGVGMVNVLKDGPAGVAALREEFARLSGDQTKFAQNSDALGDSFDSLETSLLGVRNTAAGALMPAITQLANAVTGFVVKNRDGIQRWAEKTGAAIQGWIDGGGVERLAAGLGRLADTVVRIVDRVGGLQNALGLVAIVMAGPMLIAAGQFALSLLGLGKEVVLVSLRIGSLLVSALGRAALGMLAFNFGPLLAGINAAAAATWKFTASLLANPVVLVAGLMAVAAYLIYKNWKPIAGFFSSIWTEISYEFRYTWETLKIWGPKVWTAIVDSVMSVWTPVTGFFSGLWDGITAIFVGAWARIQPITDKLMLAAQLLPGIGGAVSVVNGARSLLGGEGGAPPLGAASALPPVAGAGGTAAVRVDFANLPRGARVTPQSDGVPLDLNLGYSLAPGT